MESSSSWTLTARWVFPVDGPPLERGVVAVAGDKIAAVEVHGRLAADVDLGDAAVLPGLVNAHTHLDLSGMRGLAPPTADFTDWLRQVIAFRLSRSAEEVQADVRNGIAESMSFGTTLLGDIAAEGATWNELTRSKLRAVVFREMIGLSNERSLQAWKEMMYWKHDLLPSDTCRVGLSPHAPYSASAGAIRAVAWNGYVMAVHLAETEAEIELIERRTGPFVRLLQELGAWVPEGLAPSFDWIFRRTSRAATVLYIHGNYLPPNSPIPRNGTIVYCPRTHAAFGHPRHPFREFLARGVRVAVGTDSLASNPDLDILAEIRFLHRLYPDMPGAMLLRMATLSGAEALGWADETGSLTPGKSADLVVVPLRGDDADPYRLLLGGDLSLARVLFRGRWVVGE
jgi:cytosine/adenosine deaminase-related metal-dependent hydrolase